MTTVTQFLTILLLRRKALKTVLAASEGRQEQPKTPRRQRLKVQRAKMTFSYEIAVFESQAEGGETMVSKHAEHHFKTIISESPMDIDPSSREVGGGG